MGRKMELTLYGQMTAGLDEKETANRATNAILQYPTWRAWAMVSSYVSSPRLDGMPHGSSGENVNEKRITDRLDYAERVRVIDGILAAIKELFQDEPYLGILKWGYCYPLPTKQMVMNKVGYSSGWFYECERRALCILAVLWPTDWEMLTVTKGA